MFKSKGKMMAAYERPSDLVFEIQDPSAEGSEAGVEEITLGPGKCPLTFETISPAVGRGARVSAVLAPLGGVEVGWHLVSVNGIDVTLVGAEGVAAVLEKRSGEDRKLRFEAAPRGSEEPAPCEVGVDALAMLNLGLDFDARAKPAVVVGVRPQSLLAGRVAVGAQLLSIDGIDLTALTWAECEQVFGRLTSGKTAPSAYALKFLTPPPKDRLLDCVTFRGEATFAALRHRASAWASATDVELLSVETVARDGGEALRLWFDALRPANRRPHVAAAIAARKAEESARDVDSVVATFKAAAATAAP